MWATKRQVGMIIPTDPLFLFLPLVGFICAITTWQQNDTSSNSCSKPNWPLLSPSVAQSELQHRPSLSMPLPFQPTAVHQRSPGRPTNHESHQSAEQWVDTVDTLPLGTSINLKSLEMFMMHDVSTTCKSIEWPNFLPRSILSDIFLNWESEIYTTIRLWLIVFLPTGFRSQTWLLILLP